MLLMVILHGWVWNVCVKDECLYVVHKWKFSILICELKWVRTFFISTLSNEGKGWKFKLIFKEFSTHKNSSIFNSDYKKKVNTKISPLISSFHINAFNFSPKFLYHCACVLCDFQFFDWIFHEKKIARNFFLRFQLIDSFLTKKENYNQCHINCYKVWNTTSDWGNWLEISYAHLHYFVCFTFWINSFCKYTAQYFFIVDISLLSCDANKCVLFLSKRLKFYFLSNCEFKVIFEVLSEWGKFNISQ